MEKTKAKPRTKREAVNFVMRETSMLIDTTGAQTFLEYRGEEEDLEGKRRGDGAWWIINICLFYKEEVDFYAKLRDDSTEVEYYTPYGERRKNLPKYIEKRKREQDVKYANWAGEIPTEDEAWAFVLEKIKQLTGKTSLRVISSKRNKENNAWEIRVLFDDKTARAEFYAILHDKTAIISFFRDADSGRKRILKLKKYIESQKNS